MLVQLGLLDPTGLAAVGAEDARSVLDRNIPLNALIRRAKIGRPFTMWSLPA